VPLFLSTQERARFYNPRQVDVFRVSRTFAVVGQRVKTSRFFYIREGRKILRAFSPGRLNGLSGTKKRFFFRKEYFLQLYQGRFPQRYPRKWILIETSQAV